MPPWQLVDELKAKTESNIYFCLTRQVGAADAVTARMRLRSGRCGSTSTSSRTARITTPRWRKQSPVYSGFAIGSASLDHRLLVVTGGGLHAYWLSDRVLTVEEWQPYADGLKDAAKTAGLKFDAACTGDAARVLRVPDTLNFKYDPPRRVRLLQSGLCNGLRHDFAAVFGKILSEPKATRPGNKIADPLPDSEIAEAFKTIPVTPLAEGIELRRLPAAAARTDPPRMRLAAGGLSRPAATDFDEPQWNLTTLIATSLKDGHELAHKFGNQHSTYTEASTDKKWAEKISARAANPKLGWPQCKTIAAAGSNTLQGLPAPQTRQVAAQYWARSDHQGPRRRGDQAAWRRPVA